MNPDSSSLKQMTATEVQTLQELAGPLDPSPLETDEAPTLNQDQGLKAIQEINSLSGEFIAQTMDHKKIPVESVEVKAHIRDGSQVVAISLENSL